VKNHMFSNVTEENYQLLRKLE